ncbi:unnamed protein product, partial [Didymodactylos carnosus]
MSENVINKAYYRLMFKVIAKNGSYLMINSVLNVFNELPNVISDDQKLNYLTISRDELQLVCLYLKHFDDVNEHYWVLQGVHYLATMLHPNLTSFNHTPDKKLYAGSLLKIAFNKLTPLDTNVQDKTKTKDGKKLVSPTPKMHIDPLDEIFDNN